MGKVTSPPAIPGFTRETVNVGGTRIHYLLGGNSNGQAVLLWHGFLGTSWVWRKVAPILAKAGYAVLVPDMRGYGDSDKPAGNEGYDARSLAEEFRSLVRQIAFGKGKPLLLAGHDMGAPPALLWTADHPDEIAGLLYIEGPVMLSAVLQKIIAYTPEAMKEGSMWWWILPLAPGAPEALVVGHEREFLTWFYDKATAKREAIAAEDVDEVLRTFSGSEGVLGAMGVYRAAFTSIKQTKPLTKNKVQPPVIALGGIKGLGAKVGVMVRMIAHNVADVTLDDSGHFVPEERPDAVARYIELLSSKISKR
jgi:pimeloyl-ACP methyl ester carboxylesterase